MQVLNQPLDRPIGGADLIGRDDDGGDGLQAGLGRRPPAALAKDQFVDEFAVLITADGLDGLQHPVLLDAGRQIIQLSGVEILAGLVGGRPDPVHRDFLKSLVPWGRGMSVNSCEFGPHHLLPWLRIGFTKCGSAAVFWGARHASLQMVPGVDGRGSAFWGSASEPELLGDASPSTAGSR